MSDTKTWFCGVCRKEIGVACECGGQALTAEDVREARLDCDAHGRIFPEIKLAAALQVLRSIATEQPTASAVVRALAAATLEKLAK